ncbi:MAG: hypothetical protein ABWY62_00790 [Acidimicrobiia bacterium]
MRWRREPVDSHSDDDLAAYLADAATLFERLAADPPPPATARMEASADFEHLRWFPLPDEITPAP